MILVWHIINTFSTRVSNELGAGCPEAASLAVGIVLLLAITEGIIVVIVMILLRNLWGHLYSRETQVVKYVSAMMPILAISSFLDGIQSVLSGRYTHDITFSGLVILDLIYLIYEFHFYEKKRYL